MSGLAGVRFLVGTTAHNAHVQHLARSLYEAGALHAYMTAGVDIQRTRLSVWARAALGASAPSLARRLDRRTVTEVPAGFVHPSWTWEVLRLAARRWGSEALEDRIWELGETQLDRRCARWLDKPDVGGFLGVEHGALASLRAARAAGKPGVVAFLSPHHRTRARWVDQEFEHLPELLPAGRRRVERLSSARDARRDEEAATADWIETGSSFTTRSLVEAGFSPGKILTIPLGCPEPIPEHALPVRAPESVRFVFAGPVSVRKGAHYLLRAWSRIEGAGLELHLYGTLLLSDAVREGALNGAHGRSMTFHGSVPTADLNDAYLRSSVLVLPTLCDGFGLVVSEALAHGLPVITTANAGAADLIEHGVNGFVVAPADEDALAERLQWCADNPAALFAMRRAALASAARWTWADFRARHRALLDQALLGGTATDVDDRTEGHGSN